MSRRRLVTVTVTPEQVGLTRAEFEVLRALEEGRGRHIDPETWETVDAPLRARGLIADVDIMPLTVEDVEVDPDVDGLRARLPFPTYVTVRGRGVLHQVGTFRRPADVPWWLENHRVRELAIIAVLVVGLSWLGYVPSWISLTVAAICVGLQLGIVRWGS